MSLRGIYPVAISTLLLPDVVIPLSKITFYVTEKAARRFVGLGTCAFIFSG